jgi:hypothetical protein
MTESPTHSPHGGGNLGGYSNQKSHVKDAYADLSMIDMKKEIL